MTARPTYVIRRLTYADLLAFRAVRLEALLNYPEAFGSSFEEEAPLDLAGLGRLIRQHPPGGMFGAFAGTQLAAIAGLFVAPRLKQCHKGTVVSVYVRPAHRGSGLARDLLGAVIAAGRDAGLTLLHLTVTVGNELARRLYLGLGFQTYGLEKRALRVKGVFYDDELMALDLN